MLVTYLLENMSDYLNDSFSSHTHSIRLQYALLTKETGWAVKIKEFIMPNELKWKLLFNIELFLKTNLFL